MGFAFALIALLLFALPLGLLAIATIGRKREGTHSDWQRVRRGRAIRERNWQRATARAMANPHAWPYGDED
jgi:hypothetical protein